MLGMKRKVQVISEKSEVDALIATIRRRIEETVGVDGASSAAKVKDVFSDIDRDNSGTIDKRELEQALRVLKVNTSARDVDLLFDRFDDTKRGQLDYHNYLELLGNPSPPVTPLLSHFLTIIFLLLLSLPLPLPHYHHRH